MILKCAGCGNSIDIILLDTPAKMGEPGDWKVSFLFYRGDVCSCSLNVRNPEKRDKVIKESLKNPEKYKNTVDQLTSAYKQRKEDKGK